MHFVTVSQTERIIVRRIESHIAAEHQVKEDNKWRTDFRKEYASDWKGNLKEDMIGEYSQWSRHQEYLKQLSEPYH